MTVPFPRRPVRELARRLPALLLAALLLFPAASAQDGGGDGDEFRAVLLTGDLGDPRAPGNVKLSLTLPDALTGRAARAAAEDFQVFVFPADIRVSEGADERYRAGGVYLWRHDRDIFLDARVVPVQDRDGPALVLVRYAPGGEVLAETVAKGETNYASELVDVVLAVDVSRSMNSNDPRKRRVVAARTFIDMARRAGGIGRVGLITFNHDAHANTPLLPLSEGETLIAALGNVGADGLTNLDMPITLGIDELELAGSRRPVIILLTDGKNEGTRYRNSHLEAAEKGIRLFTVGLSEQADHRLLEEMADATGGIYFRAVKDSDLPEIYARLAAELGKRQLLHAETLWEHEGAITLPIDVTVRRLVAMADGGARVRIAGPEGRTFGGGLNSVHMGSPAPGDWIFAWEQATPGESVLSLFGDTRLFLDLFPPQLRENRLSIGATLAESDRPVREAEVWLEPPPGGTGERVKLYDDGRHGDGLAGDGVYGAEIDLADAPDFLQVTVRAVGDVPDDGAFIRQSGGRAVKVRAPPFEGDASVDGDVDFGILFPGEAGVATATVVLDAHRPRDLHFDLFWDGGGLPDLASLVPVEPGRRTFELEIEVPPDAAPGEYRGVFGISDGERIKDESAARIVVGNVVFAADDVVDLGVVAPGGFVGKQLIIPYQADKDAPFHQNVDHEDVMLTPTTRHLREGMGEATVDLIVSVPVTREAGDDEAILHLAAGPGRADVLLRWRVEAPAPVLDGGGFGADKDGDGGDTERLTVPDDAVPEVATTPDETSVWEDASQLFDDGTGLPDTAGLMDTVEFPAIDAPKTSGDGFFSGWWMYILAALLLLLLLLLLLAYILYRLGKSSLARFIVVSAIANFILLAIFIALLGAGGGVDVAARSAIAVNLVEDEYAGDVQFTPAEQDILGSVGLADAALSGGDSAAAGEASIAVDLAGAFETHAEKRVRLPEGMQAGMEIADARQPAALPMENRDREPRLRRDRQPDRADRPVPLPNLPELSEPPAESGPQVGERPLVDEARVEIAAPDESARPVWSDGSRIAQPLASDQGVLLAEAPGMEAIRLDDRARPVEPRGRRRSHTEVPSSYPEPRVDIDDPARDVLDTAAPDATEQLQGDPGLMELRVEPRSRDLALAGEKPGAVLPPGASKLTDAEPTPLPRGVSGPDRPDDAAARGGLRPTRGGGQRDGSAVAGPETPMPGGMNRNLAQSPADGPAGADQGGDVGERRFDAAPGGADNGGSGLPDSAGTLRSPVSVAGAGTAPNPFAGGDGQERAEYSPRSDAGGPRGDSRDIARRGDRSGLQPRGRDQVPDVAVGDGLATDAAPASGRGDRDDAREGRFDDMAAASGSAGGEVRENDDIPAMSGVSLVDEDDRQRLGVVPFRSGGGDWRRNDRRFKRRTVNVASSSVDMDALLLVVGDFARLPDMAAEKLFSTLAGRVGGGMRVEERRLKPTDENLVDCLLALATPEEMRAWSDDDMRAVARYLHNGGHMWLDAARPDDARSLMTRLAEVGGGVYAPLESFNQLAQDETVDALTLDDRLAAVVTYQDWRREWRYGDKKNGRTLRFLIRTLNYFLSGNAETGIVLDDAPLDGDTLVEPYADDMPESLAGADRDDGGLVWDDFGPDSASLWKMPSWSDPGRISSMPDDRGDTALRLDLRGAVKGRAAAYRVMNPPEDLTGASMLTTEIFYDGDGDARASMVFTVPSAAGWTDYETMPMALTPGWNRAVFSLDSPIFRPLTAGGGGFDQALPMDGRVGRAGFFVYRTGDAPAVVLVRNARLH